jgi:hypothetical protein
LRVPAWLAFNERVPALTVTAVADDPPVFSVKVPVPALTRVPAPEMMPEKEVLRLSRLLPTVRVAPPESKIWLEVAELLTALRVWDALTPSVAPAATVICAVVPKAPAAAMESVPALRLTIVPGAVVMTFPAAVRATVPAPPRVMVRAVPPSLIAPRFSVPAAVPLLATVMVGLPPRETVPVVRL